MHKYTVEQNFVVFFFFVQQDAKVKTPLAEVLAAQNRNAESIVEEVCDYVLMGCFFVEPMYLGFSFEHPGCLCLVKLTYFL